MKQIVVITLLVFPTLSRGQGLNNSFSIDQADLKEAMRMLGIEFYKFPLNLPDSSAYVNLILEEYHDTILTHRSEIVQRGLANAGGMFHYSNIRYV